MLFDKLKLWVVDPKTKKPSVTLTILWCGFLVCTFKLLMSDLVINGFHFEKFTGSEYAVALGALGALYSVRKYHDTKHSNEEDGI